MSAWESVSTTYLEAATAALPLQRLVVFGAGFLGALSVGVQTNSSILQAIAKLEFSKLASVGEGPLAHATIGDALSGVALVTIGWILSRGFLWLVFEFAARSTDLRRRVVADQRHETEMRSLQVGDRQAVVALLESSLQETRGRLRVFGAFAELLFGLSAGSAIAFIRGNIIDLLIGLAFFIVALMLHVIAVRIFLAEYFGAALLKSKIQGRKPPTPFGVR